MSESPIIPTRAPRRAYVNRTDLHRLAERLASLSAYLMDGDGRAIGVRSSDPLATHQAAINTVLGFLGAAAGAAIDVTDTPHPCGELFKPL